MIYYIDEIMGRGKTSAMINYVNAAPGGDRFLFVTPYLAEVARIQEACADRGFEAPREEGGKLRNVKELLANGRNIVSTHKLFEMLDPEALEYVMEYNYTLIIDEVMAVASPVDITKYDAEIITGKRGNGHPDNKEKLAEVDEETKLITWTSEDYTGRLTKYREALDTGCIYWYNSRNWIKLFPAELFLAFKDIYIMTYLFEHQLQRCYFDLLGLPYQRKYIAGDSPETYRLSDVYEPSQKMDFTHLIHVLDDEKMNRIGDGYTDLSKKWYIDHAYLSEMDRMKKNLFNYFHNIAVSPSNKNMWTTFKKEEEDKERGIFRTPDWEKMLAGRGYTKGFVACNTRGTNQYRDKTTLAYTINVFPHTVIKNFLSAKGVRLNQSYYALSEMIQWIWRSAIRDGKEINVYIPSARMRKLLLDWMDACKAGREMS